jgi:hypothetical protein
MFVLWCACVCPVQAETRQDDPDLLHVAETRWGFDGTIQKRTFIPLSVLVQNVSPAPWEGRLRLFRWAGTDHRLGMTLELEVSLQPDESRWVQLVPYIVDDLENWTLTWGPEERHRIEMTNLTVGVRPTVLIFDRAAVAPPGGALRRMPEELFPTSVTATDGLRGVILSHAPFWQGARAQAFLDWLARGGRVYLLHDEEGRFPRFPAPLGVLNDSRETFRVGTGTVRHIPRQVGEIDLEFARRELFNDDWPHSHAVSLTRQFNTATPSTFSGSWSPNGDLFRGLASVAEFHRQWWLIYSCVLGYLLMLWPGCYVVGVERRDVRRFYTLFFGTAVGFSVLFVYLGQLGASARNRVRSVALAHSLGEGRFDVTQWSVAANVNPGTFTLAHAGTGRTYSTCQDLEHVDGRFLIGHESEVHLTMLPASTRTLLHRTRISIDRPVPRLVESELGPAGLERVQFSVRGSFERRVWKALAIFRGQVYELEPEGGMLVSNRIKRPESISTFLERPSHWKLNRWGMWEQEDEELMPRSRQYIEMIRPLTGNSFGLKQEITPRLLQMDSGSLRLLVYTPMPNEFQPRGSDFPDQQGCALFCYDYNLGH